MRAALLVISCLLIAFLVGGKIADARKQPARVVGYGQIRFNGLGPERWAQRYRRERALRQRLEDRLEARAARARRLAAVGPRSFALGSVAASMYAIRLASAVFGVSESAMRAVAYCETGGSFSPFAKNRSSTASGLFQFLDSTWSAQGVAGFSVFDPIANALGAARIAAREGWRQWSCRP